MMTCPVCRGEGKATVGRVKSFDATAWFAKPVTEAKKLDEMEKLVGLIETLRQSGNELTPAAIPIWEEVKPMILAQIKQRREQCQKESTK